MNVSIVNLSNDLYRNSRERLNDSAVKFGITQIFSHDFENIKNTEFYRKNKSLLDTPKGLGYWSWKPYIILEALKKVNDGDIVVYADCGLEIIDNLAPLLDIVNNKEDILLFSNGNLLNARWTKRDCFILMECDNKDYWYSLQCDAAFSLFKKTGKSISFVEEWLRYALDTRIISSDKNVMGGKNIPGFREHRWDQSILSLLAKKTNIEFYRVPSQFGNHYKCPAFRVDNEFNCINQVDQRQVSFYSKKYYQNSRYYQLLNHHRGKNTFVQEDPLEKESFLKRRWRKYSGRIHYFFYRIGNIFS